MKHLIGLLVILALSLSVSAQYTTPRFGVSSDIFGGQKGVKYTESFGLTSTADATGADTVKLFGTNFKQYVQPSSGLVDSLTYCFKSLASCYAFDEFLFDLKSTGSTKVKFRNKYTTAFIWSVAAADSTISLTSGQELIIKFIFNGTKWVEQGKTIK